MCFIRRDERADDGLNNSDCFSLVKMANSKRSVQQVDNSKRNINADFIESVKKEWKAIDQLKNELMKTDAKIRKLGKESSSVQVADIQDCKVRKRKIAWSDDRVEGSGTNSKLETDVIKNVQMRTNSCVDSKESSNHHHHISLSPAFIDTNAFDQLKNQIEKELKNASSVSDIAAVPIRLLNEPPSSSKSVHVTDNSYQPQLHEAGGLISGPAPPPHGILKMTRVDPQVHKPLHHQVYNKSAQNPVVTTKSLKTDVTKWRGLVDGPVANINNALIDGSHQTVKEPSFKSQTQPSILIPPHIKMTWEPIMLPADDVPQIVKIIDSIPTPAKNQLHMSDEADITSKINPDLPKPAMKQKRVQILEKDIRSDLTKGPSLPNRKEPKKQKRVICEPKKVEEPVITPFSWRKGKQRILAEQNPMQNNVILDANQTAKPQDLHNKETASLDNSQTPNSKEADNEETNDSTLKEKSESLPLPKKSAKVSLKSLIPKAEEPVRQSTPKLRHYDQASVRKYIKKQREERRLKYENDKLMKQKMSEDKKQKMEELQHLQKSLAQTPIKITKKRRLNEPKALSEFDSNSSNSTDVDDDESSTDLLLNRPYYHTGHKARSTKVNKKPSKESPIEHLEVSHESDIKPKPREPVMKEDRATSISEPSAASEDNRKKVNEQLKALSAMYQETIGNLVDKMKDSTTNTGRGHEDKLRRIRNQAKHLQKAIDEQMQRLRSKQVLQSETSIVKSNSADTYENGAEDRLDGHIKSSEVSNISRSSMISEGTISSTDPDMNDYSNASPSEILRKIALNTVVGKTKLDVQPSLLINEDWRKLLPAEPPDPQNFVNSWARKFTSVNTAENSDRAQDGSSRSSVSVEPTINDEGPAEAIASDHVPTVITPTLSRTSSEMEMRSMDSVKRPVSNNGSERGSSKSFSELSFNEKSIKSPEDVTSQHSVSGTSSDEQLSEGPLTLSDFDQVSVKMAMHKDPTEDKSVVANDSDTLSGQQSLPSDNREAELDLSASMASSASRNTVVHDVDGTGDHVISQYAENGIVAKMMSPNTLRLRLSTELTYLDNVHESLGQLQDVERIRAVSVAQNEAVALAKYIQTQPIPKNDDKQHSERSKEMNQYKVLQSQAEAVKSSAEAAKQLAEINKAILERRPTNVNVDDRNDINVTATVAATSAAVTAALSQLKHRLQNSRSNRRKISDGTSIRQSTDSERYTSDERQKSSSDRSTENSSNPKGSSETSKISDNNASSGNLKASSQVSSHLLKRSLSSTSNGSVAEELSYSEQRGSRNTYSESPVNDAVVSGSMKSDVPEQTSLKSVISAASSLSKFSKMSPLATGDDLSDSSLASKSSDNLSVDMLTNFGDKTFRQFTLAMVKQNVAVEEQRIKHQEALIQFREKALLDKAKAEFEWIKLKRKQSAMKGDHVKVALLKKRQGYLIEKLKQDQAELKSIREQEKLAIRERRSILRQQEEVARLFISNEVKFGKLNKSRAVDVIQADTGEPSRLKHGDQMEKLPKKSDSLIVEDNESSDKIKKESAQSIKKIHSSKRYLASREQSIMQRRQTAEDLINWQQKLDKEEMEVQRMEKEFLKMLEIKNKIATESSLSVSEDNIGREPLQDSLPRSISKTEATTIEEKKSVSEVINTEHEESNKSSDSIVEEYLHSADSSETIATNTLIDRKNLTASTSVVEQLSLNGSNAPLSNYSSQENSVHNSDREQESAIMSFDSVRPKSIVLREPLAPARAQTRRRRDSSGSEESGPISQSETTSDVSDIEGRIFALKEDLRLRRKEAEWLKKEQKRKTKDRLKSQETSLLKQIEAYDRFIVQTKVDLQKELDEVSSSKVVVKPVIKTPKVAESKRLHRQPGMDKSPDSELAKLIPESPLFVENDDALVSAKSSGDPIDNALSESAVMAGNTTSVEFDEDILESPRTNSLDSSHISTETQYENTSPKAADQGETLMEHIEEGVVNKGIETPSYDEVSMKSAAEPHNLLLKTKQESNSDFSAVVDELQDGTSFLQSFHEQLPDDEKSKRSEDFEIGVASDKSDDLSSFLLEETIIHEDQPERNVHDEIVNRNDKFADRMVETLLQKMLSTEIQKVLAKRNEPKATQTVASNSNTNQIGETISDNVFNMLLTDSVSTIFRILKSSTNCRDSGGCLKELSFGNESQLDDVDSKRSLTFLHESYITQRVNDIMAEVNDKRSLASKTRSQDMFVLSFGDALSSPESSLSPVPDSPIRGGPSSPVKRPSSPVLGESGEINMGDSVASFGLTTNQLPPEGVGEDEWFDDDFGLSDGQARSPGAVNQMRRYQVYPYQDFYYIREIPNKPPPPYTPPGQALIAPSSGSSPPGPAPALLNVAGTVISKVDLNKISGEIYRVIHYDNDHIKRMINTATAFVYAKVGDDVEMNLDSDEIEGYFTVEDMEEDSNNRSRRVYKEFLLTLVYEIVNSIFQVTKQPCQPIWCKQAGLSNRHLSVPKTLEDLLPVVQTRISELLFQPSWTSKAKKLKWGRKKRDFVDEILLQELRLEESEWTTYNEDELTVKTQLSDSIFDMMMADTVDAVKQTWLRKYGCKTGLLISDL